MKLACVLLLLLVPTIGYADDTCDVISAEFYNDIKLSLKYGHYVNRQVYFPVPSPSLFSSLAINGDSCQVVIGC